MFDFEKLEVYLKAKAFNAAVANFIDNVILSKNKKDQLERAAFSIMLNIAEGSGRFTKPDKKTFTSLQEVLLLSAWQFSTICTAKRLLMRKLTGNFIFHLKKFQKCSIH